MIQAQPTPSLPAARTIGIGLLLLTLWYLDFPHQVISAEIGRLFPWPSEHSLKLPALLLERTLIEALVCIPAAFILALCLRRAGIYVAVLLAAVFARKIAAQAAAYTAMSNEWRFLLFIAAIHILLLVGGTVYLNCRAARRDS